LIAGLSSVALGAVTNPLGPYKVSDVTVSGLSAGAYMAVQMHVAYSSVVNGSAIFAGGPFYCAKANLMYAEFQCMMVSMGEPDVAQLVTLTQTDATKGLVDKTSNMKDDRVYLFSGKDDSVVDPKVMKSLQTYYQSFVDVSNIVADYNLDAEHCIPTLDYGESCSRLSSPYIGKCNFDGAGAAFETLYGTLNAAVTPVAKNLMSFSQTPFFSGTKTSLGDTGYIYVPTACQSGTTCRLHVSFHGCEQTLDDIDNAYAAEAGFNKWAESNNIIVLYPYAKKSSVPSNPNGCFDWWAYTDANYGTNEGVQMIFARELIKEVSGL